MGTITTADGTEIFYGAGPLSARLVQNGTLKTYKGSPHGMPTTRAETINADLLAFVRS
jgi:non-heme chloroperoxidase